MKTPAHARDETSSNSQKSLIWWLGIVETVGHRLMRNCYFYYIIIYFRHSQLDLTQIMSRVNNNVHMQKIIYLHRRMSGIPNWISSCGALAYSDLVASGSCDGVGKLLFTYDAFIYTSPTPTCIYIYTYIYVCVCIYIYI